MISYDLILQDLTDAQFNPGAYRCIGDLKATYPSLMCGSMNEANTFYPPVAPSVIFPQLDCLHP